jgi:hypothetical protein
VEWRELVIISVPFRRAVYGREQSPFTAALAITANDVADTLRNSELILA